MDLDAKVSQNSKYGNEIFTKRNSNRNYKERQIKNDIVIKELQVHTYKSQLRWNGHSNKMDKENSERMMLETISLSSCSKEHWFHRLARRGITIYTSNPT